MAGECDNISASSMCIFQYTIFKMLLHLSPHLIPVASWTGQDGYMVPIYQIQTWSLDNWCDSLEATELCLLTSSPGLLTPFCSLMLILYWLECPINKKNWLLGLQYIREFTYKDDSADLGTQHEIPLGLIRNSWPDRYKQELPYRWLYLQTMG